MVKWSFPGSLYFENTRKNFKSNLVFVVELALIEQKTNERGSWQEHYNFYYICNFIIHIFNMIQLEYIKAINS